MRAAIHGDLGDDGRALRRRRIEANGARQRSYRGQKQETREQRNRTRNCASFG